MGLLETEAIFKPLPGRRIDAAVAPRIGIANGDCIMILLKELHIREANLLNDIEKKVVDWAKSQHWWNDNENLISKMIKRYLDGQHKDKMNVTVSMEFTTAGKTVSVPIGPIHDVTDDYDLKIKQGEVILALPRMRVKDVLFVTANVTSTSMALSKLGKVSEILNISGSFVGAVAGNYGTAGSGVIHTAAELINFAAKQYGEDFLITESKQLKVADIQQFKGLRALEEGSLIFQEKNDQISDDKKTRVIFEVVKAPDLPDLQKIEEQFNRFPPGIRRYEGGG